MKTSRFDAAEHLTDPVEQATLLREAVESGDPAFLAHALGTIARAHGMSDLVRETGLNRQQLYKSLSKEGNPTLSTLLRVTKALGLTLTFEPSAPAAHV
jgi:probable addiction module antidote protein